IGVIDFSVTPMTVDVNITGASTQNFNVVINTGTLGAGATSNYVVTTTCDLTAVGIHTFSVTTTVSGDADSGNDVLAPVDIVNQISVTAGSNAGTICEGGSVDL